MSEQDVNRIVGICIGVFRERMGDIENSDLDAFYKDTFDAVREKLGILTHGYCEQSEGVSSHKLTGGLVYECESHGWGWGIRNKHGLVCKVFKPSKFQGQDERFARETAEYRSVVEFIISAMNATLPPSNSEKVRDAAEAFREIQEIIGPVLIGGSDADRIKLVCKKALATLAAEVKS